MRLNNFKTVEADKVEFVVPSNNFQTMEIAKWLRKEFLCIKYRVSKVITEGSQGRKGKAVEAEEEEEEKVVSR